ncbi:UDP-3-O-[3-hydroxymyristoyl] glucosamine N-acyltransferase LpxD [Trema orientale]|uniref:UDP-3-O-[3-hydroxymyristoyl] glucosamine N-acyltransferase LpxD n=1 Tax=Trema orientale TaxID=63057 RepID=A0A2P5B9I1_TREOI|nr:UDP-3-O-[3-hydroxymyristoyl] glucosamine N-acyltransferase LpxD [Trema orientale]
MYRRPLFQAPIFLPLSLRSALSLPRISTFSFSNAENHKNVEQPTITKSTFIHPTAIIHPNAVIGQGVSIGPFCTVGSSAKLGNGCKLYSGSHIYGNTELGEHCVLMTGAVVGDDLPGRTVMGCNNIVGHYAVVGLRCQDLKYQGDECFLDVGENNDIREHTSIHRSSKSSDRTVIGNNNLIMGSSHIAHDCKLGNNNIFANHTRLAGHVVVEEHDEKLANVPAVRYMVHSIRDSFEENRRGICKYRQWNSS